MGSAISKAATFKESPVEKFRFLTSITGVAFTIVYAVGFTILVSLIGWLIQLKA